MLSGIKGRDFLSLKDYSEKEIHLLIDLSIKLKKEKQKNRFRYRLKNRSIAMIFEKTSTRTRCATSIACFDEGAYAELLGKNDIQLGDKESIEDTARVLSRMYNAILYRGYKQEIVEKLANFADIPVINGLTDLYHPTQILADFMTVKEIFGDLNKKKIAFFGDGCNNVANSLIIGAAKVGMNLSIAAPKQFWPDKNIVGRYQELFTSHNCELIITEDPYVASKDSDVIYTDVWVSMGQENDNNIKKKIELMKPYCVNKALMNSSGKKETIFLHCLPATHNGEQHDLEVTEEVFESDKSFVFDQAENRLHTIKAILVAVLGGKT